MGTPSNRPKSARDILRDLVCDPAHSLSAADLRTTGVDVDLLEATYKSDIHPYLDYLAGYKSLIDQDPSDQRCMYTAAEDWKTVVGRANLLGKRRQWLTVGKSSASCFNRPIEELVFAVYLARDGEWLLWHAEWGKRGRPPQNETLTLCKTTRELCDVYLQKVPRVYESYNRRVPTFPLMVAAGLRDRMHATITEREARIATMKQALDTATQRVSNIPI